MQVLMHTDNKDKMLLISGFFTSLLAWSEVNRIDKILSVMSSAIDHCCKSTHDQCCKYTYYQSCNWHVVKVFGAGITLDNSRAPCIRSKLKDLSSQYILQHTVNILTGLIGIATVTSMIIVISKRILGQKRNEECADCCTNPTNNRKVAEVGKNIGLFISFASLTINQFINFTSAMTQQFKTNILDNRCCDWEWTDPNNARCLSALESTYGSGLTISNSADLCGGNLWIAKDNHTASIVKTTIMMAAIGTFALGWIIKYSCCCTDENTNNTESLEQIDSEYSEVDPKDSSSG